MHPLSLSVLDWPEKVREDNKRVEYYDFNKYKNYDNGNNVIKQDDL